MLSSTEPLNPGFVVAPDNLTCGEFLKKIKGYNVTLKYSCNTQLTMDADKFKLSDFPNIVAYRLNFSVERRDITVNRLPLDSPHFNGPLGHVMARSQPPNDDQEIFNHPLYQIFMAAILQAMNGKGERHGGAKVPFMQQPWVERARLHGRGFLTGQADKKIGEAASTREGEAFETELLGAMVYAGMAVIYERNKKEEKK